ncbi:MAG TPA: cytochrome c [Methylomirabilota bacterium]|nr:cytochrome c [Methylomirabilota bacterium]
MAQIRVAPRIPLMCRQTNRFLLMAAAVVMLLAACELVWAQARGTTTGGSQPPFDLADPSIVEAGSRLFRANCTHYCHNPEGRAARAPALRGRSELSPEFIYQRIVRGAPPMPAFGTTLSAEQIWTLVAYIESIAKAKD